MCWGLPVRGVLSLPADCVFSVIDYSPPLFGVCLSASRARCPGSGTRRRHASLTSPSASPPVLTVPDVALSITPRCGPEFAREFVSVRSCHVRQFTSLQTVVTESWQSFSASVTR